MSKVFLFCRQGQLCIRCLRGVERGDDMSSMLDGDDDDRSAISSLILPPSGQDSPREDLVTNKLVKFDVSIWTILLHVFKESVIALLSFCRNSFLLLTTCTFNLPYIFLSCVTTLTHSSAYYANRLTSLTR